jgi:hypothetical protein
MNAGYNLIITIVIIFLHNGVNWIEHPDYSTLINTSHLDYLYEEITVEDRLMGIVRIYCEYPDYFLTWETQEGIACIDDAARAAIFYTQFYNTNKKKIYLQKAKKLIEFLLYMQAENGYFYNFIFEDYRINTSYQRSIAIPDWWTWRALWALSEIYEIMIDEDKHLASRMWESIINAIESIKKDFSSEQTSRDIAGFKIPTWLPAGGAADQAAVLLMGLCRYYKFQADPEIYKIIERLCKGIIQMQVGNSQRFPFGAFLSWENKWHAWGNIQSSALLRANKILNKKEIEKAVLKELDNFYNFLIVERFYCEFEIKKDKHQIILLNSSKTPQIAYGIRPMIWAAIEAFEMTGDKKYARQAGEIAKWFFGKNISNKIIYDTVTGRCFDGIIENGMINRNSGAESTIEALLALSVIEQNHISRETLQTILSPELN